VTALDIISTTIFNDLVWVIGPYALGFLFGYVFLTAGPRVWEAFKRVYDAEHYGSMTAEELAFNKRLLIVAAGFTIVFIGLCFINLGTVCITSFGL